MNIEIISIEFKPARIFYLVRIFVIVYLLYMNLNGKTAIITGASGQLGGRIAICLAKQGLNCLCHYWHNEGRANEIVKTIQSLGLEANASQADLNSPESAAVLTAEAKKLGPVRVLINSASIFLRQRIESLSREEVSTLMAVNLIAPIYLSHEFARYLEEEGLSCQKTQESFAAIINLVDVAGIKPWAEYGPYCASRAGLIGLTKSLAKELAPGITVNAIAPGIVTWPGKMNPAEEEKQLEMIPAGRFGESDDVARTIEFLLDNDYITGQVICVDGGRSI